MRQVKYQVDYCIIIHQPIKVSITAKSKREAERLAFEEFAERFDKLTFKDLIGNIDLIQSDIKLIKRERRKVNE